MECGAGLAPTEERGSTEMLGGAGAAMGCKNEVGARCGAEGGLRAADAACDNDSWAELGSVDLAACCCSLEPDSLIAPPRGETGPLKVELTSVLFCLAATCCSPGCE